MIYRTYGQTGIEVSAIGCGGMRFEDQNDVDGCASLIKTAYDKGVTFFDTARRTANPKISTASRSRWRSTVSC